MRHNPDSAWDRKAKVLLVDDNAELRSIVTKQLEKLGFDVESTGNASGFLGALSSARDPFAFAVIDMRLPDLSGDQIMSWLFESELDAVRSMPILIITGFPQAVRRSQLPAGKRVGVLAKPFGFKALEQEVARLLSGQAVH